MESLHIGLVMAFALVAAARAGPAAAPTNEALVSNLLDPNERDRAICELLRRQKSPEPEDCHVNSVLVAPQGPNRPVFVVFLSHSWSAKYARPGVPKGHFILLGSDGALLPVFWNADVLEENGGVIRYAGDERLALALIVRVADGRFGSAGLQTLNIVPIEAKPRSLLSVILGPSGREVATGERRKSASTSAAETCVAVEPSSW